MRHLEIDILVSGWGHVTDGCAFQQIARLYPYRLRMDGLASLDKKRGRCVMTKTMSTTTNTNLQVN